MISFIVTAIGGLLTVTAETDGGRVVAGAILAAGLSSSLRQLEKGGS